MVCRKEGGLIRLNPPKARTFSAPSLAELIAAILSVVLLWAIFTTDRHIEFLILEAYRMEASQARLPLSTTSLYFPLV